MSDRKYQKLLKRLLDFDLKILNPWKQGTEQRKWSMLFHLFTSCHIGFVLLLVTFVCFEPYLSLTEIFENLSTAMQISRSFVYVWLVLWFHGAYKILFDKMNYLRSKLPSDQNERLLTEAVCRREYKIVFAFHMFISMATFGIHAIIYLFPNDYHLLYNCYLFFMPLDSFWFAWELNYFFMTFTSFFVQIFFVCYVPLPLLLMNQTCWLLDMTLMTAEQMNKDLQPEDDITDLRRVEKLNRDLEKFVDRCQKVVKWRDEVQKSLYWSFNLEFQTQAITLCFSIYVLSLDFFASYIVLNVFLICLGQLFIYCWMGTRVASRHDQLSFQISKNWHLMPVKQRKIVQMIVHWTQNMNGFTGAFKNVNLETFQTILQASYSFYAFLQSSRD